GGRGRRGRRRRELRICCGVVGGSSAWLILRSYCVQRVAAALLEPVLREPERAALVLGVAPGDSEAVLRATQVEVRGRDLRREQDAHAAQVLFGGVEQRVPPVERAAQAAEDVQLPAELHTRVPDVQVGRRAQIGRAHV